MTDIDKDTTANDSAALDNPAAESAAPAPASAAEPPAEKLHPLDKSISDALAAHEKKLVDTDVTAAPKTALPGSTAVAAPQAEPGAVVDPITGRTLEPIKPPVGMPPALREKWGKVDREFQQYWADRERNMATTLQQTADARKFTEEFRKIAQPFEDYLKEFNITPTAHADELFKLSYSLNKGTPVQRAQILVNLIQHFKPDAATMQALFSGQQVNVAPITTPAPKPNMDEAVQAEIEKRKAAEQQQAVQAEIDKFAETAEFYNDVREMMGRAIDGGFVQGNTMSELMKNAYDFCCQNHPEIKGILASRGAAAVQPAAQPAQAAKPVASVKPSLGAGAASKTPTKKMSLDEAINKAMEPHLR